jgi:undecaprenyl diphosphate synthase
MDGNGRWAEQRQLPRIAGHRAGVEVVRGIARACAGKGIEALTLFAFSSENWHRPKQEVGLLMELFMNALQQEIDNLNEDRIRFRLIGDASALPGKLQEYIHNAERLTAANQGLALVIAANYGGRWDIAQTARVLARKVAAGVIKPEDITEGSVQAHLALGDLPDPDLFIRTGGERRISNYLLWQLAYTELYFMDCLWPDFSEEHLESALNWYATRQRRFGRTSEQVRQTRRA